MRIERLGGELVFYRVVLANRLQAQAWNGNGGSCRRDLALGKKALLLDMPELQMLSAPLQNLSAQVYEENLDAHFHRGWAFAFNLRRFEVLPVIEVVLLNGREAVKPVRPENQVKSLANGTLSDVVRPDQKGMATEFQLGRPNTAEIFNR